MDARIETLRKQNVYVGTSSWKYSGWKGSVYRHSYESEKDFNERALEEYSRQYTTVGVDHTYYAWPDDRTLRKYYDQTPAYFRFGLKVTEEITVYRYPSLKRYGKNAGKVNASFLDANLLKEKFLSPLMPYRDRIGPIMLEFSQFYPGTLASGSEFTRRLSLFLDELGTFDNFSFGVEIRNQNWLQKPYFDVLCKHQVAHVMNSWTRMPSLQNQLSLVESYRLPFFVARLLLQPGTKYAEAVEAFSPYDKICEEQPQLRSGGAHVIQSAIRRGIPAYIFVNNRAEGCAPKTIEGILDALGEPVKPMT